MTFNPEAFKPGAGEGKRTGPYRSINFQAEVAAMDTDRKGGVDLEEFMKAQLGRLPAHDADRDGFISKEEFRQSNGLKAHEHVDSAKQLEELYWRAMFKRFDADGSGSLTAKELEQMLSSHQVGEWVEALSADESNFRFDTFTYESMSQSLLKQNPYLIKMMRDVEVGDLVFVQGSGLVADATKGPWTHVAICIEKGPPPSFVESVGMTGSPGSRGLTRQSGFVQFVGDTDVALGKQPTFAIVRPTRDPKIIAAAVEFAKQQVGKPYDFAFSHKNDMFYCSELAYAAYNQNPLMPKLDEPILGLKRDEQRNRQVVLSKALLRAVGVDDSDAGKVLGAFNSGKRDEAIESGLRTIGKAIARHVLAPLELFGANPPKAEVSYRFVSPSLLLEGNKNAIVGTYRP